MSAPTVPPPEAVQVAAFKALLLLEEWSHCLQVDDDSHQCGLGERMCGDCFDRVAAALACLEGVLRPGPGSAP